MRSSTTRPRRSNTSSRNAGTRVAGDGESMSAVALIAQRRLARHWRALVVAGVLLGLVFGLCLASRAAARRTSSAYDRILTHADAPDAAVNLSERPEAGARAL